MKTVKSGYALKYAEKEEATGVIASVKGARLRLARGSKTPNEPQWRNMLIRGDNLMALSALMDERSISGSLMNADGGPGVRLIYIDPPFSTKLKFRARGNEPAYDDIMTGAEFVEFLRKRLIIMRELLSEDGSIYVHLDWKKAHAIKIVMDEIFGEENFLNDIVWSYGGRGAKAVAGQFSRNHDIILLYRKNRHVFNRQFVFRNVTKGANGFKMDPIGRWFKTSPRGDYTDESIKRLEKEGRIHRTKTGSIRVKYFLDEEDGQLIEKMPLGDVWDDIPDAMHLSGAEKTGYPTQKPEALLRRIICASSNPGDIVLDAFAGSGTTLVAADGLSRRWIGIDSGALAIDTIKKRFLSAKEGRPAQYAVYETAPCARK